MENLRRESVAGQVEEVGDVMADVALMLQPRARERTQVLERFGVRAGEFVLVTAHRAGNVDDPARLRDLVELLEALPLAGGAAAAPAHPRRAWSRRACWPGWRRRRR